MIRHIFLDKTATLVKGSATNTGLNPVVELNYGDMVTRFILHFDLTEVDRMWRENVFNLDETTFTLKMTNCTAINGVPYEKLVFFGNTCIEKERASSFTLLALALDRDFDAGRGFEFADDTWITKNKSYTESGCNWYQCANGNPWENDGVYSSEKIKEFYDAFDRSGDTTTCVGVQHFDFGDEQLQIDITDYVKDVLNEKRGNYGLMLCFTPALEELNGGAEFVKIKGIPDGQEFTTYTEMPSTKDVTVPDFFVIEKSVPVAESNCTDVESAETIVERTCYKKVIKEIKQQYVGFFTNNTNTFFHPYVELEYTGIIKDDRECFYAGKENRLYLYSNINGKPENLDGMPDCDVTCGEIVGGVKQATKGVYYVTVKTPKDAKCICYDTWSNLKYDKVELDDVELEAPVLDRGYFQVGSSDVKHEHLVPQVYGINDDECVTQNEVREVVVDFRKKYTTNERQTISEAAYRLYTKDGERQIDIFNGYQPIERSFLHNYFMLYTKDLIPNNKYYVDIKIRDGREERFFEDVLHFRIVDNVTERYA